MIGVQAGVKTGIAKVEGGIMTTEIGKAGLSTKKRVYAEKGGERGHNFVGGNVKLLNNKLSIGAKAVLGVEVNLRIGIKR